MTTLNQEIRAFQNNFGKFGEREVRTFQFDSPIEVRESGAGDGQFTITGYASVFDRKSLDLGGFQEIIEQDAFTNALSSPDLDVHALWDHSTLHPLARTPKTLDLQQDDIGLRFWARVVNTNYAKDLRALMEAEVIDQASFAFTVARDTWMIEEDGTGNEVVTRIIHEIDTLYDVTVTARGAYPQTTSQIVRSYILDYAHENSEPVPALNEVETQSAVQDDPADTSLVAQDEPGGQRVNLAKAKTRIRRAKLKL